jgi:hypothetical protein
MSAMSDLDIEIQMAVSAACRRSGPLFWKTFTYDSGDVRVLCVEVAGGSRMMVLEDGCWLSEHGPSTLEGCWADVPGRIVCQPHEGELWVHVEQDPLWRLDDIYMADERGVVLLDADDPRATVCGHCGAAWDDTVSTAWTPAPSGRCPFEYDHDHDYEVA